MERLISVQEAAALLGLRPWTIYEWCRSGRLPCVRLGRTVKLNPVSLRAFIAARERGPGSPELSPHAR